MALKFLNNGYFAGKVGIGTETSYTVGGTAQVTIATGSAETALAFGPSNNDMLYMRSAGSQGNFQFQTSVNSGNSGSIQLQPFGGNVGIGTTTPNAKLDIQGTQGQLFSVTDDLSGEIFAVADISGVPIMAVNSSGTSYFDGDLGVGTSTPLAKLEVNVASGDGILIKSADVATLKFKGSGGVSNWGFASTNLTAGDFGLYESNSVGGDPISAGTSRIMIKPGGNVGIGTNDPECKLHTKVGTSGGSPYDSSVGIFAEGATRSIIQMSSTSDAYLMFGDASVNNQAWFGYNHATNQLLLHTGSTITMDGNVGIGTTDPLAELQVGLSTSNTGNRSTLAMFGAAESGILNALSLVNTTGAAATGYGTRINFHLSSNYSPTGCIEVVTEDLTSNATDSTMRFSTYGTIGSSTTYQSRLEISSAGAIKFNDYNSTKQTGTPTYMLGTDASGNVVKVLGGDIPGVPGGSGTLNTVPLWTPDGDTLGDSPITISGNDIISSGRGVIENTTNLTTGVVDSLLIKTLSSGTTITNGFGGGLSFYLENTVYSAVNEVGKNCSY